MVWRENENQAIDSRYHNVNVAGWLLVHRCTGAPMPSRFRHAMLRGTHQIPLFTGYQLKIYPTTATIVHSHISISLPFLFSLSIASHAMKSKSNSFITTIAFAIPISKLPVRNLVRWTRTIPPELGTRIIFLYIASYTYRICIFEYSATQCPISLATSRSFFSNFSIINITPIRPTAREREHNVIESVKSVFFIIGLSSWNKLVVADWERLCIRLAVKTGRRRRTPHEQDVRPVEEPSVWSDTNSGGGGGEIRWWERWTMDSGRWTVDGGRWTVDGGRWATDGGRWTMDGGRWTVNGERRQVGGRDGTKE